MSIPQKFLQADGTPNVQALAASFNQLGGNASEHIQADGTINATSLSAAYLERERISSQAAAADAGGGVAVIDTKTIEAEDSGKIDWEKVQFDANGTIVSASRSALQAAGVPDHIINGFEAGQRAVRENNTLRLAGTLPNGMEDYKAMTEWVNRTFDQPQRVAMSAALNGPGGEMALVGYFQQFQAANAAAKQSGEPDLSGIDTTGGGGGVLGSGAGGGGSLGEQPFSSQTERNAAFRDRRYGTDHEYTTLVHARARATSATVAELQKTNPSKNWVPPTRRQNK